MKNLIVLLSAICFFTAVLMPTANATTIGIDAFVNPEIIDFEGAPAGSIDNHYDRVTFTNLWGWGSFDTGAGGVSRVASNFDSIGDTFYNPATIQWDAKVIRAGFFITTNEEDDVTLIASLFGEDVSLEVHTFDTGGVGVGGSFIGIEFLQGFDYLAIFAANNANGAFAIDNLHFEYAPAPVPEPATIFLLGTGMLGLGGYVRRRKLKS